VGAELRLRPLNIPIDLTNIVDDTPITISVALNGEVRAPGAETIASAFFRDPTQVDNPDPLAGASTITFDTVPTGPVVSAPEPSALGTLGPALLALWACCRRWRRAPPAPRARPAATSICWTVEPRLTASGITSSADRSATPAR
jgi:hypothetical protein